jgi:hypothetical protein
MASAMKPFQRTLVWKIEENSPAVASRHRRSGSHRRAVPAPVATMAIASAASIPFHSSPEKSAL